MKYFIQTYGCQMNKSDSERIAGMLKTLGYKEVSSEDEADLIVLNTCVVRQSAEDRVYGKLKNLEKLKTQNSKPCPEQSRRIKTCVTGCMASLYPEKIKEKTDLVFSIDDLPKLPQLLENTNSNGKPFTVKDYLSLIPKYQTNYHAFVPIMTGCNNFCSYCVVPYARGQERSRSAKDILKEVTDLVSKGYKALTLVGQNVNSYQGKSKVKSQKSKVIDFPTLLKMVNAIPNNFWVWFVTSHPKDMSDELIEVIAQCKKVCPYIHLPVQSGNNKILKAMNRGYTREYYINLVEKIRKKSPDLALSTDVIVGFPGETKSQFQDTVNLFKKIKFDMAYIAQYSPRPKTTAYKLKDDIPSCEKKRREKVLTEILKKTALEHNKKLVGKTIEVLVEVDKRGSKRKFTLIGKTKTFKTIKFESSKNLIGQIVKVKITQAMLWGLKGEII